MRGMMRRIALLAAWLVLAALPFTANAQTNKNMKTTSYENLWAAVEQARKDDHPQTAIEVAERIQKKAEAEGNAAQLIKSTLTLMAQRENVSEDSATVDIEHAESLLASAKAPAERALLHALLASVYEQMGRGSLTWTDEDSEAKFEQKCKEHYREALAEMPQLAGVSAKPYEPLYTPHEDSKIYKDDVLSLVVDFVTEHAELDEQQKMEIFREASAIYADKGMRSAAMLMEMRQMECAMRLDSRKARLSNEAHAARLKAMYETYPQEAAAADACLEYAGTVENAQERLELVRWAQKQWPKSPLAANFKRLEQACLAPWLNIRTEGKIYPGRPIKLKMEHRNVEKATLKVRRVERRKNEWVDLPETVVMKGLTFAPSATEAQEMVEDSMEISMPAGDFRVYVEAKGAQGDIIVHVTSMYAFSYALPDGSRWAVVCDVETGQPISGCTVEGTWSERVNGKWTDQKETHTTDAQGRVQLGKKVEQVSARRSETDKTTAFYLNNWRDRDRNEDWERDYSVFTDRGAYRPGQTVHAAGLAYAQKGDSVRAKEHVKVTFRLLDANGKEVAKAEATTDAMGMAWADLTIPKDRLNGMWTVKMERGSASIRVEEYKRPTFQTEILPVEGNFALGDTIEMTGKATTYSGVAVQGAKVAYKVTQREGSFWRWWRGGSEETVETGETVTDEEGKFRVKIYLDDDMVDQDDLRKVMVYTLEADITDQGGESHSAEGSVRASRAEFALDCDLPEMICTDEKMPGIDITAKNTQGEEVAAQGQWKLLNRDKQQVAQGAFSTEKPLETSAWKDLPKGTYTLQLEAKDGKGNSIKSEEKFVLWSAKSKGAMALESDFLHCSADEFGPGQDVDIYFACAKPDAYTYLYIVSNKQVIEERIELRDTSLGHIRLKYKEEYGDGVSIMLAYVKEGELHSLRSTVVRTRPQKQLQLKWTTFRDKLTPGQQEEWTLQVVDAQGKPVSANVLATMYDASLDAYQQLLWRFGLSFDRNVRSISVSGSHGNYGWGVSPDFNLPGIETYDRMFNDLTPYNGYYLYSYRRRHFFGGRMLRATAMAKVSNAIAMDEEVAEDAVSYSIAAPEAAMAADVVTEEMLEMEEEEEAPQQAPTVQPRENLNETAFFYPDLHTDKNGAVSIAFTLPECLTEWRFMAFAHTPDLNYGRTEQRVVARKEFMVQPNCPRFVRMGDQMGLATRIINTSDKAISGTAQMRLLDAQTLEEVFCQKQQFSVNAGQTSSVNFTYDVPEDYPMLVCEITGDGGTFADGERNYIPVLTSKKFITETIPFYIDGAGTASVDLQPLFNNHSPSATQRSMAVEYTDNPSWTAVMALHSVVNPTNTDAVSWSAALYANAVAQSLAKRMPRLQSLIAQWNNEPTNADNTLQSELEKNAELKEILLQESPWMLQADDETQQRHLLCQLFDQNLLNQRISKAKQQLQRLQYDNGAWAWFEGMRPSYYTTLLVAQHLAMLSHYQQSTGEDNGFAQTLLAKAIPYLDSEELTRYKRYYEKDKNLLPSESTCHWLYVKTLANHTDKGNDVKRMTEDYLSRVEKRPADLTILGKAHLALVLLHHKHTEKAYLFTESLRQYLVSKPGLGDYYDTDAAYYSWLDYRIPTHLAAMRTFLATQNHFSDNHQRLVQMHLWLLRQKQSQKWDNIANTINACDLLLTITPDTTFHPEQAPAIALGGQTLALPQPTAGLGYVKTAVPAELIDATQATVSKQTPGVSWGCFYAQALEEINQVQQHTTGDVSISHQLYVEENGQWRALGEGEHLHVGNKVRVRYTIRADRDADFLQIRAQHAACFEPLRLRSGYQNLGGRGGYLAIHDASADVFFDKYNKGTSTIDIDYYVNRTGTYTLGLATLQSAYNPQLTAHTRSLSVVVE